ncbi:hypothetical protein SAMN04487819_102201 [Actinopolyspora alba]|uniref:Uncharacterized protein n=1 Tax=Actinopolyspora alba TaxID=673379 RepID=A0A1I1UI84_9ACTN|nr:hypothetical protein SAMN04487819_102201 [Actinopolyspora alba]
MNGEDERDNSRDRWVLTKGGDVDAVIETNSCQLYLYINSRTPLQRTENTESAPT